MRWGNTFTTSPSQPHSSFLQAVLMDSVSRVFSSISTRKKNLLSYTCGKRKEKRRSPFHFGFLNSCKRTWFMTYANHLSFRQWLIALNKIRLGTSVPGTLAVLYICSLNAPVHLSHSWAVAICPLFGVAETRKLGTGSVKATPLFTVSVELSLRVLLQSKARK